jgi:hypothetical protein
MLTSQSALPFDTIQSEVGMAKNDWAAQYTNVRTNSPALCPASFSDLLVDHLPIYYFIVGLQVRTILKLKGIGANCKGLIRLAWIQASLPIMIVILYPFMPGSTATGEPLGLNEKAYLSHAATLILMFVCFIAFALKAGKIKKTKQNLSSTTQFSAR